ncbi:MAG: Maf family protein [Fusobacteriaceae bacterium]
MILASKSPRRREILENAGFDVTVDYISIDEISDKVDILEKIKDIAKKKAEIMLSKYPDRTIISADTIVELNSEILGKPKDEKEAVLMLKKLSGKTHRVITGYCVLNKEKKIKILNCSISLVTFKTLTEETIEWYIEKKESLDKAGAYGIQGKGAILIEKIEGDFYSIMGFPLSQYVEDLKEIGISLKDIYKI